VSLHHQGRDRPYELVLPRGNAATGMPLVVELHGRGIDPLSFDRWTRFSQLAVAEGFVLAMPGAIDGIWNDGRFGDTRRKAVDDVGYLTDVIADTLSSTGADPGRVYLVGMSNGAAMAARFACERSTLIAGLAQVAGTAATAIVSSCLPASPIPVIQIHGAADRIAPYAGGRAKGWIAQLMLRRSATGPSLGVDGWAEFWVRANGANPELQLERLGTDTEIRRWSGSSPSSDVWFYRVENAGHTWPGARGLPGLFFGSTSHTFDATRVIWEFLSNR
jgi:polyhydroxybutyrate depolymerase